MHHVEQKILEFFFLKMMLLIVPLRIPKSGIRANFSFYDLEKFVVDKNRGVVPSFVV